MDDLLNEIRARLAQLPPVVRYEPEPEPQPAPESLGKHPVQIRREGNVYFVEAPWLLQVLRTIRFDDSESMQYFERVLNECGVIDALRAAGCTEGDTVSMYDLEFDFVD